MRKPFSLALTGLALVGCGPSAGGADAGPPPPDPCQILASDEARPGSPFNFQQFTSDILPDLQTTCGTAGCHLAPSGQGGYNVWAANDPQCADVQSFNAFYNRVDFRINPANSVLLKNMDSSDPHPVSYVDSPLLTEFPDFIQAAFIEYTGGGNDQSGYFDETVYAQQIQPLLDSAGCHGAGCHNKTDNAGTDGLNPNPAPGSPEMSENFADVILSNSVKWAARAGVKKIDFNRGGVDRRAIAGRGRDCDLTLQYPGHQGRSASSIVKAS